MTLYITFSILVGLLFVYIDAKLCITSNKPEAIAGIGVSLLWPLIFVLLIVYAPYYLVHKLGKR